MHTGVPGYIKAVLLLALAISILVIHLLIVFIMDQHCRGEQIGPKHAWRKHYVIKVRIKRDAKENNL